MEPIPDKHSIDLLKATSRSFYLILHCGTRLPAAVRPQIGLAHLLARHFHRPFRTKLFTPDIQGLRPWLISGVASRQCFVPEGQLEISQPQGGWINRPTINRVLKGRRKIRCLRLI